MKRMSLFSSIASWTRADLATKYDRSLLGIVWYLINPVVTFVILFFAFRETFGTQIPFYESYLVLGIIIFNFFQNAVVESAHTLYDNRFTIKAININLEGLVLTPLSKALIGHLFEFILLAVVIVVSGGNIFHLAWYPVVLLPLVLFTAGFVYIFSVIGVYIADLSNIILFAIRILWFATPIFYVLPAKSLIAIANTFNPFFYLLELSRQLIIFNNASSGLLLLTTGVSACVFIAGKTIWNAHRQHLAESI